MAGEALETALRLAVERSQDAAFYRLGGRPPGAPGGAPARPGTAWFSALPPTSAGDLGGGQSFWRVRPEAAAELVEVPSGALYPLTAGDLEALVAGAKAALAGLAGPGRAVGLFLGLGDLRLLPLLVFRACVELGATALRYGTANIPRQLWLGEMFPCDVVVASPATWRHLASASPELARSPWVACVTLPGAGEKPAAEGLPGGAARVLAAHPAVPACFLQGPDGRFSCPGYYCEAAAGELHLTTTGLEGFSLLRFGTGIQARVEAGPAGGQALWLGAPPDGAPATPGSVRERVLKVLRRRQPAEGALAPDGRINLDSVGLVELLVALEEELSFTSEVEEIDRAAFATLEGLVAFVERKLAGAGRAEGGGGA